MVNEKMLGVIHVQRGAHLGRGVGGQNRNMTPTVVYLYFPLYCPKVSPTKCLYQIMVFEMIFDKMILKSLLYTTQFKGFGISESSHQNQNIEIFLALKIP